MMKNIKKSLSTGSVFLVLIVAVMSIVGCDKVQEEAAPEVQAETKALPKISETARRHFDRGLAAVEMATDSGDYNDAVIEFKKAVELAPEWTSAIYNLALVQDKAGEYEPAMANLEIVMESASSDEEIAEIQSLINKIEYKSEKKEEPQEVVLQEYVAPVVEEDTRPVAIPEIDARVDEVRFYTAARHEVPDDERTYTKLFAKNTTTYICTEIAFDVLKRWIGGDFALERVYISPNGSIERTTTNIHIDPSWSRPKTTFNWGSESPGTWSTGRWLLELYYKGNLIVSEEFTVY